MSMYDIKIETFSEEEAKDKLCPIRSSIEDKHCVASKCMFWIKTLKNRYIPKGLKDTTTVLYDGKQSDLIFEGYCGLIENKFYSNK